MAALEQGLEHLRPAEMERLKTFLASEERKTAHYNAIGEYADMCWEKCVTTTGQTASRLTAGDKQCVSYCVERFMDSMFHVTDFITKGASR